MREVGNLEAERGEAPHPEPNQASPPGTVGPPRKDFTGAGRYMPAVPLAPGRVPVEPVTSVPPRVKSEFSNGVRMEVAGGKHAFLQCSAQGFPVPAFR